MMANTFPEFVMHSEIRGRAEGFRGAGRLRIAVDRFHANAGRWRWEKALLFKWGYRARSLMTKLEFCGLKPLADNI